MYVLIVEDNPIQSYDLSETLSALCDNVREAADVETAMNLVAEELPHLALLDYNLDDETSAPVAAYLAEAEVPFVYLTADPESVKRDADVPDCPIVRKPYSVSEVLGLAGQLMRRLDGDGRQHARSG